jgi:iron complex outermembrane receptor protein
MKQAVDVGLPSLLDIGLASGPGFFSFEQQPQIEDSKAAYGQLTWAVSDRVNFTAGLRNSREQKDRDGRNVFRYSFDAVQPPLYYGPYDESKTVVTGINYARGRWSATDWKVGFDLQVKPSHMVYGNVGTGFKTGGYDDGVNRTFKPEHVLTYEIGSKNRFFNDSLQLNAVLYRSDYKDLQITGTGIDPVTGLRYAATVNAAKAHTTGLEVELQAKPSTHDYLALSVGLMDAKYGDFPTGSLGDTWHTTDFNYQGFHLRAAPSFTGTLSYGHDFDLGNSATLTPEFKSRYTSSQYMHYTNFPISYQGSYTKSDFTLTYSKGMWEARAFVHNIENKVVFSYVSPNNPPTTAWYYLQDPRTFGLGFRVKFQ